MIPGEILLESRRQRTDMQLSNTRDPSQRTNAAEADSLGFHLGVTMPPQHFPSLQFQLLLTVTHPERVLQTYLGVRTDPRFSLKGTVFSLPLVQLRCHGLVKAIGSQPVSAPSVQLPFVGNVIRGLSVTSPVHHFPIHSSLTL